MDRTKWVYKKLGDICTSITDGSHNPPKGIEHSDYRMISSQNIYDDELRITDESVRFLTEENHYKEDKRTKLSKDVVLLTIVGTIGRACVLKGKEGFLTLQRSVAALHPSSEIQSRFLMYCLIGSRGKLEQEAHGIAQRGIYLKQLSELRIPLPNLAIQQSVILELDKLNEVIGLKRKQLADLDSLAQSLFYEMFGDPVVNEKGWTTKDLKEIGKITTGNTPSKAVAEYYNNSYIEWIKTDNIEPDSPIATAAKEFLSEEGCKRGRVVEEGSLLVACIAGSVESIGKSCITNRRVAFNQQINAITPNESTNIVFLYHLVRSMKKVIQDYATTGMKHILTKSAMEGITIPLPPLLLQQSFATKIAKIEAEKQRVKSSIKDLETLLASRMQYWFD